VVALEVFTEVITEADLPHRMQVVSPWRQLPPAAFKLRHAILEEVSFGLYNGSVAQVTGTAFPGSVDGFTLDNPAGLTLNVNMRIQNTNNLTLTNGSITLGNFNLTLQALELTIGGGANSATKMIITNGTGMLVKIFTSASSYTYPIGDNTGTG
jgi:hypothetical protein